MKLKTILVVLYLVVLGQFLYSNFVQVIGPNYLIHTQAYNNNYNQFCPPIDGKHVNPIECVSSCPLWTADQPAHLPKHKGFPFATNDFWIICDTFTNYASKDFKEARLLNIAYIISVTGLFGLVIYKVRSTKRQP